MNTLQMSLTSYFRLIPVLVAAIALCTTTATWAQDSSAASKETPAQAEQEKQTETTESVQEEVDKSVEDKASAKRDKLVDEAVSVVRMTRDALASLDKKEPEEALKTLAEITGKLELLVARNPKLSLIPVGVTTKIHDLYSSVETVKSVVEKAEEALDDGQVQVARELLEPLASEVVISTTHLPLATYPDAIKKVAPLIDDGKIAEAKQQLQVALNTLIVSNEIYPLPELRIQEMVKEARELSEKKERSKKENARLEELFEEMRTQVEFGRTLGYFTDKEAKSYDDEIEQIQSKTSGGKSGKGFFDKLWGLFDW